MLCKCMQGHVYCILYGVLFSVDGADFSATTPMFNFGMGPVSQVCIDVTIIDDTNLEGDHTFTVDLGTTSVPLGGTGSPTSTTITIQDPEGIYIIVGIILLITFACSGMFSRLNDYIKSHFEDFPYSMPFVAKIPSLQDVL